MRFFKKFEWMPHHFFSANSAKNNQIFDVSGKDQKEIYKTAYNLAGCGGNTPDYEQAAICIMQVKKLSHIYVWDLPRLTYTQLKEITAANPASATRLFADARNFKLFTHIELVVDYLKLFPHVHNLILDNKEILELIGGHESLGKVLRVAPMSFSFLIKEKGLDYLIKYESNLIHLASLAPQCMFKLLQIPDLLNLIKTPSALVTMIVQAPDLIYLLRDGKFNSMLTDGLQRELRLGLEVKARTNVVSAQKAMGIAREENLIKFPEDNCSAIDYFEMAAKEDLYSANKVGKFYLHKLKDIIERNEDWNFEDLVNIGDKVPSNSDSYCGALIVLANCVLGAIKSKSVHETEVGYLKQKKEYLKLALHYLISAYELQEDLFETRLLDQILCAYYLDTNFLQGELKERSALILRYRKENYSENNKNLFDTIKKYMSRNLAHSYQGGKNGFTV